MISVLLAALSWLVITLLCAGVIFACGRLFFWRQVASPGALFVALALVTFGVSNLHLASSPLASWHLARKDLFDAATPVRALFFLFFCVFPEGRLVWRVTRWLLVFYAVFVLGLPFPFVSPTQTPGASHGLSDVLYELAIAVALIPQLALYRDLSAAGERLGAVRVLAGLGTGVVLLVITVLFTRAASSSLPVLVARTAWYLVVSLVPVSLGLALLRARLYDRAALIRRALIYGFLSVGLSLTYFAGMGGLPALFGPILSGTLRAQGPKVSSGDLRAIEPVVALIFANLLSILIMAVLFQPLRHLLQTAIDRRFYRRLSDTARGFAAFSATAHEEIRVDALSQRALALLQATLHPRAATLWVRVHLAEDAAALSAAVASHAHGRPRAPAPQPIELYRWAPTNGATAERATLALLPDDPLSTALLRAPWPVALECVPASSPAASGLRAAGTSSAVPLLDRGDLVGLIALSDHPRLFDVREIVATLGIELAPALRVAQYIHEQEVQARQRERVEQELEMARRIQQSFLPHAVPSLDGWQITSHYRPAREVGGDFYDLLTLADGRLGLIVGDVTDKGVPAALVMAATRSMLRAAAQQQGSPGAVLAQVNDLLCPDVPAGMFVTCFYAILDPATGYLRYANAGHELPYHRHEGAVTELYARGMPLGLMPARGYEEGEAVLQPGETVLLYSDGLVEAHDRRRDMFGRARLARLVGDIGGDTALIDRVLSDLAGFTQPGWEQEDDITLVTLHRRSAAGDKETLSEHDRACAR